MENRINRSKYAEFEPHLDDITCFLKEQLEQAKANKNTQEASKFQQQIWAIKDYKANILRNIDPKTLDDAFEQFRPVLNNMNQRDEKTEKTKKLKNLMKKRDQIYVLREKQRNGEQLEANQIEKINNLEKIQSEIDELNNFELLV